MGRRGDPSGRRHRKPGVLQVRHAQLQARQRRHDAIRRAITRVQAGEAGVWLRLAGYDLELRPAAEAWRHDLFVALVRTRRYGIRLAGVVTKDAGRVTVLLFPAETRSLGLRRNMVVAHVATVAQNGVQITEPWALF